MKNNINANLAVINEAGIQVESGFETLRKQLISMIEAAIHWLSEADLQKRLLQIGVIDTNEYDKRVAALVVGPGEGPNASFEEVYKDTELCIERCTAAIKALDRIHDQLTSDPNQAAGTTTGFQYGGEF